MRGLTRGKYLDEPENIFITRPPNITGRGVTHTRWYGHGHIGHSGGHTEYSHGGVQTTVATPGVVRGVSIALVSALSHLQFSVYKTCSSTRLASQSVTKLRTRQKEVS